MQDFDLPSAAQVGEIQNRLLTLLKEMRTPAHFRIKCLQKFHASLSNKSSAYKIQQGEGWKERNQALRPRNYQP